VFAALPNVEKKPTPVESELGEKWLYENDLRDRVDCIFDVGSRDKSLYISHTGPVHFFDPVHQSLVSLEQKDGNTNHVFNGLGLSNSQTRERYYPDVESFSSRRGTLPWRYIKNLLRLKNRPLHLELKRGDDYCTVHNISKIDFLKIDTEGREVRVLRGFGHYLDVTELIQFEYGGTWIDMNIHLHDALDYLGTYGFDSFYHLTSGGIVPLSSTKDDFEYANILAFRSESSLGIKLRTEFTEV